MQDKRVMRINKKARNGLLKRGWDLTENRIKGSKEGVDEGWRKRSRCVRGKA